MNNQLSSYPRKLMTRRRLLIVCALVIFAPVIWWLTSYPRGMVMACCDQICGHYEIQLYGTNFSLSTRERDRLLNERYGVKCNCVAGCVIHTDFVSTDPAWYAEGYNSVSKSLLYARFGKDVFAECNSDAGEAWRRKHQGN